MDKKVIWHKVLSNKKDLPEGRVKTVTANVLGNPLEDMTIVLPHFLSKKKMMRFMWVLKRRHRMKKPSQI